MARPIVAWSFSALGDFKNCPYKYWAVKVGKIVSDVNQYNKSGDDHHHEFELYVSRGVKLPESMQRYTPMLEKFRRAAGQIYTEHQMALDVDYMPCGYKDWDKAWVRAITDYMVINGSVATIIDWKFGKVKKDPEQNSLTAAVVFQAFPQVQLARTAYVYAPHDKIVPYDFKREDAPGIWNTFLPDVNRLAQAKQRDEWPKTPNPLCGWCPVTTCQHNTNSDAQERERGGSPS